MTQAFVQRLRELGYVDGKNIVIEWRYAAGDVARLPQIASDLVRLKIDVIMVGTNYIAEVTKRATRTIPIVIPAAVDPVGSGLAESLAHPGGNVTGLSVMNAELAGKKLQFLREVIPNIRRVAVLALAHATEPGFATGARLLIDQLREPAQQLGITILPQAPGVAADIPKAFAAMRRDGAKALIVQSSALSFEHRKLIAELAAQQHLPAIYDFKYAAEAGGLISYGPDMVQMFLRSAELVDKIFKGANPAEIPFEQPSKYELVINLKTAKALGLIIPPTVLLRADRLIE
jgi:putative ABC transport system substrate-binding protein